MGKCRDDGGVEEQGEQIVIDWCLGKASRAGGNSIIRLHKIRAKLILIYLSGYMQNHHGKHKLFRVHNDVFRLFPITGGSCLMRLLGPGKIRISQKSH